MKYILEIRKLSGGYVPLINILQDVSLELVNGETVSIIGLNGSGKSTLGKAVMNMLPYRDGDILLRADPLQGLLRMIWRVLGWLLCYRVGRCSKAFQSRRTFNWHSEDKTINLI